MAATRQASSRSSATIERPEALHETMLDREAARSFRQDHRLGCSPVFVSPHKKEAPERLERSGVSPFKARRAAPESPRRRSQPPPHRRLHACSQWHRSSTRSPPQPGRWRSKVHQHSSPLSRPSRLRHPGPRSRLPESSASSLACTPSDRPDGSTTTGSRGTAGSGPRLRPSPCRPRLRLLRRPPLRLGASRWLRG